MTLGRIFGGVAAGVLVSLAVPAAAAAHFRAGVVAVNLRTTVVSPAPSPDGAFAVRVSQKDRSLSLAVRSGHTVVVLGYLGEPFLRVGDAGVEVNLDSPTAAASGLLARTSRRSGWLLERGRRSVTWRDARAQRLPAGTSRITWRVPILVDGHRQAIVGRLSRLSRPDLEASIVVVALVLLLAAGLAVRRRPNRMRAGCVALGVASAAAAIVAAGAFAFGGYATPGLWIAGFDEAVFVAVGIGVIVWGPPSAEVPAGVGLGALGLAIGASFGDVFSNANVLSILPAGVTRVAAALAISAGIGGAALGGLFFTRVEAERQSERNVGLVSR
jgi:hypothetical protein